jgi:outer membrane receptor protein involved in Fe transport
VEITTASRQKEKIGDIPASVVVVTRDDIETYGYQSLAEILRNIPGLYLTDDYVTENFGVRGFWTIDPQRNIIIRVNDVPQVNHFINANVLEMINIPVEAIDRIEVVRGPMSVMYGTGAFFGAINIKTNIVKKIFPISLVSASAGPGKTYKLAARASGRYEDFQYSFNGSFFDTYGIDEPYSKMVRNPAVLQLLGVPENQTTGSQLENMEKYFNFSGAYNGVSVDAQFSESHKEIAFISPSLADGTLMVLRSLRLNFGYAKKFSDKIRAEAKFGYFLDKWTFDFDMQLPNFYAVQTNGASGYKAELLMFFDPSPQFKIILGLSHNKVPEVVHEYNVPAFNLNFFHFNLADHESMVTNAIYTQVDYKLSDKFKIVAGLRLEQTPEYELQFKQGDFSGTYTTTEATYSHTKVEFIPRLALIWGINENNYLKFLYGKAINRPSFFQNTGIFLSDRPTLKPETIQTFELNYIGNLSSTLSVSLSLFHNILDELIFRSLFLVGDEYTTYQANVGKMTTNGIELTFTYYPSRKFNLQISGTYQDTKEDREGVFENFEPGYSPKFLGYIKASYFFTREISLAITGNYVGEMESYYDDILSIPGRLGEKVDGYFLLGANLRIRDMFNTGWFLNLRGSNLLDQEIRYPTTSNNANFAYRGTIGRGLSFLLTLGYQF